MPGSAELSCFPFLGQESSCFSQVPGGCVLRAFFCFVSLTLFSKKNFALGSPQSHDLRLAGPIHPRCSPRVCRTCIHNEVPSPATMRAGICIFGSQLGFMVP